MSAPSCDITISLIISTFSVISLSFCFNYEISAAFLSAATFFGGSMAVVGLLVIAAVLGTSVGFFS